MLVINPYLGSTFWEFFGILIGRLGYILRGDIKLNQLASDEVQLFVLLLLTCSSSLVGTFLVLRKMTMLANSLAHTTLLGIIMLFLIQGTYAFNLTSLMFAALAISYLTTRLTRFCQHSFQLQDDASIGLVFTALFACAILLISLFARHTHLGLEVIMGNVDALHYRDLFPALVLLGGNLLLIMLLFKPLVISTFDPLLGRSFRIPFFALSELLMLQTGANAIISFRAVGSFLFLALLVVPVVTARFFVASVKKLLLLSVCIGSLVSLLAVALARHIFSVYAVPLSTSGLLVSLLALFFIQGFAYHSLKRGQTG